jgi:hypothetical protein
MNPEEKTRFTLRIEKRLFEKIKKIADENKRSAVKQIEYMLEQCVEQFK